MYQGRNSSGNRYGRGSKSSSRNSEYRGQSKSLGGRYASKGSYNTRSRDNRNNHNKKGSSFRGERIAYERYIFKAQVAEHHTTYVVDTKYLDFDLANILKDNLERRKYVHPTQIQAQAIPQVIAGNDILAIANTGSGKTASFLIPVINKAIEDRATKCLIITPTREIAMQIKNEFDLFALNAGLKRVLIIGGENMGRQMAELRRNPQFIIGTPGRLKDLYERKQLKLSQFNVVVLDEVDRMLDMGFVPDIKFLISKLSKPRQSLFFSATMSTAAEQIANALLTDPIKIEISTQSPIKNVEQNIIKVSGQTEKFETLHQLLIKAEFSKVLVFAKTKRSADVLAEELKTRGLRTDAIHGNKSQHQRTKALASFKRGEIKILIATDVAARGIDVPDISHVINYDEPATYSDYIHRIGRTGRIGKKGFALTFVR